MGYAPEFRTSLESLENILIYNAQGQYDGLLIRVAAPFERSHRCRMD